MRAATMLSQFAIYDSPDDYPGTFVVREWRITGRGIEPGRAAFAETLEAARKLVPEGMIPIGRSPDDDAHVVEVWT